MEETDAEKLEYIKKNSTLAEELYRCDRFKGLDYEEICKILEERGKSTIGLKIKIDRGIMLGIINYYIDRRFPSDKKFFMTNEGKKIYDRIPSVG